MKKLGMLSLAAAALLLLSGCDQKAGNGHGQKAAATQEAAQPAPKVETKDAPKVNAEQKVESGDQAPAQKSMTEEAKPAQEVTSQANQQVQEAQEKAKEAKEEVKANAAKAAETAQAATSEAQGKIDAAKLYAKCASCHGPKGEKHALGKSAVIAEMTKDEILKKLKEYQAGTLNQYGMGPLMKGQVTGLSEAELEALAAYISKAK